MIRNSFIFLEKISIGKEKNIWKQGVKDWNHFLNCNDINGISKNKKHYYDRKIEEAQKALKEENYNYFLGKLPQKEMWRFYDLLKDECCFLDIEIDGKGKIILVGISDYFNSNFFVRNVNLGKDGIENELAKYKMIITFNGESLKIEINQIHIDLKPLCVNLGLVGGLKEVERILNLKRPSHLYGNPIDLWQAFHASGDKEYLDLLIEYNKEDCENLKMVMEYVWKKMSEDYFSNTST